MGKTTEIAPLDPMEDLNREVREVMSRAAAEAMALIPKYVGHNPVRVMRVASVMSHALSSVLVDVGAGPDGDEDEGVHEGYNYPIAVPKTAKRFQKSLAPEEALSAMTDSTGELNLSARVRNLTSAIKTARELNDEALATQIREELDATLAVMRKARPSQAAPEAQEDEAEAVPDPPLPDAIDYEYTDPADAVA